MHKKDEVSKALTTQKLLPLYYHESAQVSMDILKSLYEAGIRIIEYTNRGANALQNFKALRDLCNTTLPGMLLGIGTIKTPAQAQEYIDAGADFIVCPTVNADVAKTTHTAGLLWIPGCMTPTEIASAEAAGATLVKLFPGNLLGPSYMSAIKELFPALQFMPTGGVEATMDNLKSWFGAGVVAVGMGSKLISKEVVEKQAYAQLKDSAAEVLALVKQAGTN